MAESSKIEWTDATWNPVTGCTMVSAGCTNCYAMGLAATRLRHHPSRAGLTRESGGRPVWTGEVRLNEGWLDQPLRWSRPRRIFVCAHGDLFHEAVPDAWIDRVFAVMALAPRHTFQVLTKRPERMRAYLTDLDLPARLGCEAEKSSPSLLADRAIFHISTWDEDRGVEAWPVVWLLPHVWLGTSVEDQAAADARIPHLLATPAAVRFVSAEPLLGPVDLRRWLDPLGIRCPDVCPDARYLLPEEVDYLCEEGAVEVVALCPSCGLPAQATGYDPRIDWVIVGGESGPGARPMDEAWARSLRDQCREAAVPFFFKQMARKAPIPDDLLVREWPAREAPGRLP